ncbi:MAG: type IV toxin-antitoxin system AbiEi family antitoxin domain-containing protein [Candidatus Ancillula sp.]|jgi:predicted transcriptional regulator of viral defense system|nr:type IV toxin-antitoxin system AbiEi family antitoxin domain-containing protein [Candidatus Ancillula sp.]
MSNQIPKTQQLLNFAKKHGGYISTEQVRKLGINRSSLYSLVNRGKLKKDNRGVYVIPGANDDCLFSFQQRYSKGIYALDTALFIHDLAEHLPERLVMVYPHGYNTSGLISDAILPKTESPRYYGKGAKLIKSPEGNNIKCYSIERTLCDIVRPVNHLPINVIAEAYNRYSERSEHDLDTLMKFADLLSVRAQVQSELLKVLL